MSVDNLPLDSVISLTKVSIVGDASVTRNRGKIKHVYDFVATCDWKLSVMDTTSIVMCKENNLPVRVYDMNIENALSEIIDGKEIGTLIG